MSGSLLVETRMGPEDTVDEVARALVAESVRPVPPSVTRATPLFGADGYAAEWNRRAQVAARTGLAVTQVEHLLRRYGSAIEEVLELVVGRPELAERIPGAEEYLAAEAVYAASHEGALHLEDVLVRRTRIAMEAADRGLVAAEPVARLMAEVLGWDEERRKREVDAYETRVMAEQAAEAEPDDRSADAARRAAPDVRAIGPDPAA